MKIILLLLTLITFSCSNSDDNNVLTPTGDIPIELNDSLFGPLSKDSAVSMEKNGVLKLKIATKETASAVDSIKWTAPINGTLTFNSDSSYFEFIPTENYEGYDILKYKVHTADGWSREATITIKIGSPAENTDTDGTELKNSTVTTPVNTSVNIKIPAENSSSLDSLNWVSPLNGEVTFDFATSSFEFTPAKDYEGYDTLKYTVHNSKGWSHQVIVTIKVGSPVLDTSSNSSETTSTDVIDDMSITTLQNSSAEMYVTLNPVTVTYDSIKWSNPSKGTIKFDYSQSKFTYTPATDYNGFDSFIYKVHTKNGWSEYSTISITVGTPVTSAPIIDDVHVDMLTNSNKEIAISLDVPVSEIDSLVWDTPLNGDASYNFNSGSFLYTPVEGFVGDDSFYYKVKTGNGWSNEAMIYIKVN